MKQQRPRTRRIVLDGGGVELPAAGTATLVVRFLDYVRHERALSENTQAAYRRDLRDFREWLGDRAAATLSVRDLGDYFAALAKRGLARASIARQAATLRTFYSFLQLEGVVTQSPAELLTAAKRDDAIPGTLSPAQVDRLLAGPEAKTPVGIRDRALLELLYATGCRASEVSAMRLSDVHLAESFCTCRGKGDKERVVPLGRRAIAAVAAWIEGPRRAFATRAGSQPAWVILSSRGNRLSRMRIWEVVREHAAGAGIP
ncbi:site-specific tyrosine recombinase XerD, partial [bacterium]|nr:site-specific tyrosine recombinase XerD [bacterium]